MNRWSFNMPLFSQLPNVLDITGTEIARRCELRQQVLSRYITNESVVTIQVLLKLCNALRMPAYYFVSVDNNFVIPNRESATIPLNEWHEISWNKEVVEQTFGDGEGRIKWKDVATAMNTSLQKPHERFALRTRFKVTDFFTACNAFGLSPFMFLNDPNRPVGKTKRRAAIPSYAELQRRVDTLEHDIADLKQRFTTLLHRQEELTKRVNVNIQNVQSSHIGIDHIGIAADERPDAQKSE